MSKGTTTKRQINHAAQASTYSPASAPGIIPQLTGDTGILRRFSIAGWVAGTSTSPSNSPRSSAQFGSPQVSAEASASPPETSPIQPQSTGGLWSSWWNSSGGDKEVVSGNKTQEKEEKSPSWYVDGIRRGRTADMKLVKHLISLRVHLSTADLAWIQEFVSEAKGVDSLGDLLASLVAKNGKRKKLQNVEETVLLEVIKCVRVLLNTDVSRKLCPSSCEADLARSRVSGGASQALC